MTKFHELVYLLKTVKCYSIQFIYSMDDLDDYGALALGLCHNNKNKVYMTRTGRLDFSKNEAYEFLKRKKFVKANIEKDHQLHTLHTIEKKKNESFDHFLDRIINYEAFSEEILGSL